jgi:hypothetical protein
MGRVRTVGLRRARTHVRDRPVARRAPDPHTEHRLVLCHRIDTEPCAALAARRWMHAGAMPAVMSSSSPAKKSAAPGRGTALISDPGP